MKKLPNCKTCNDAGKYKLLGKWYRCACTPTPIVEKIDGVATVDWIQCTVFVVTGTDMHRRNRFSRSYPATTAGFMQASCHNPYYGNLWAVDLQGKRHHVKRWWN